MENYVTKKEFTNYVLRDTSQKQRTILLKVSVKRRLGWNFVIRKYLQKHDVSILIQCNPYGLQLSAKDEALKMDEIFPNEDGAGFHVDLTKFLQGISEHRYEAEPYKKHPFFIKETKESPVYFNEDTKCYINPVLKVDRDRNASWILKWALGWDPKQHVIEYFHTGGK